MLYGPYQFLYAFPIVITLVLIIPLKRKNTTYKYYIVTFLIVCALTALTEYITWNIHYYLYGVSLWNYGDTFTCTYKAVCFIPTTLFGILGFLAIVFINPLIEKFEKKIPIVLTIITLIIVLVDIMFTYII